MPPSSNPAYWKPIRPNFNRRARHHDYNRPAKYLITILKNPALPPFSKIEGNPKFPESIRILLSPLGEAIAKAFREWLPLYPFAVPAFVIMPDHIHICVDVVAYIPTGLSRAIARLMGKSSRAYHDALPEERRPQEMIPLFSKGYNDRIAYSPERWLRGINYTNDNPRRFLIKKLHPDFLLKRWILKVSGEKRYVMMGNIFLLKEPHLFRVKTSRRFTPAEAVKATEEWKRELFNGSIPISPFIHPHEKELRDFAVDEGYSYIRICTHGFAERQSPSGKEFELMAQGRLLLIGQPEFSSRKEELRYSFAQDLNGLALEIAEACNRGKSLFIDTP